TVHDVFSLTDPDWFSAKHRAGFRLAMREVREHSAAVTTNSRATAEALVEHGGVDPSTITVVPHGISRTFLDGVNDADAASAAAAIGLEPREFALYVGDFNPRKNVITLIRALGAMKRPVHVVLSGPDGPGLDPARAEAARLNVSHLVHVLGYVPDKTLAE